MHANPVPICDDPFARDIDQWAAHPKIAFDGWIAQALDTKGRPSKKSTREVYGSMWDKFCSRLAVSGDADPTRATESDVADFLSAIALESKAEHCERYARVLHKAYAAMSKQKPELARLARRAQIFSRPARSNDPMPFFAAGERELIFAELARPSEFDTRSDISAARAKALCALMFGAGFKPSEALAIPVNCAWEDEAPYCCRDGRQKAAGMRAPMDPRAWPALRSWLEFARGRGSPLMFASETESCPGRPLDYANAFVGVKALLRAAGIESAASASEARRRGARFKACHPRPANGAARASPQTLRNSYGAMLLESGAGIEDLRRSMGFSKQSFARRFAEAHRSWAMEAGLADHPPACWL